MDMGLRQGRHIDRDDGDLYGLMLDSQEYLEPFYRRYGCPLTHAADGYFYLHPVGEQLGRLLVALYDGLGIWVVEASERD
jgi:chromosome partition protein MukE